MGGGGGTGRDQLDVTIVVEGQGVRCVGEDLSDRRFVQAMRDPASGFDREYIEADLSAQLPDEFGQTIDAVLLPKTARISRNPSAPGAPTIGGLPVPIP